MSSYPGALNTLSADPTDPGFQEYLNRRKPNPLSWEIPQAAMSSSGSSYGQLSPDGDDGARSLGDPNAFTPSSSGAAGGGATAQPQASGDIGSPSAASGSLINSGGAAKMPPPGAETTAPYKGTPAPPPQAQPPAPTPAATPQAPPPDAITQQIGDVTKRMAARTAPTTIQSGPGAWAQRLGLAVLAATKLAPYAQQIIRPKYTEQLGAYQAGQKDDESQLQRLNQAQDIAGKNQDRQAQAADRLKMADPHNNMREIDAAYAKENLPWLMPEIAPDGSPHYWVDKAVESTLSKPVSEQKLVTVPEGASLYDPSEGKMVVTGTPKATKLAEGEQPLGPLVPQMNQALAARYQVLHPNGPLPPYFTLPPGATQGDYTRIDKALEGTEKALGTKYQQDVSNDMRRQTMALLALNSQNKSDTAGKQATLKAFQPSVDSAERFNIMTENYEKAIKNHDQQAMLSLLANHLGMTMGLQKGARINQATINEAAKSTPWLQSIGAKFDSDGYLNGLTLAPEQMHQMVALGQSRFSQDTVKSRNEAQYLGATDDGPKRDPGKSTMNYYLGMARGDVNRAKQLAKADGWSVQ